VNVTRTSRVWILTGVGLILLVGLIHFVDAPDSMEESTLKGLSFYANFAGAALAAVGIWMDKTWGWALGTLVAAGAFVAYIISRTVGIFGLPPDVWLEPIGIASLVVEALFIAVALRALTGSRQGAPERAA
jgi:hypothetical protein